jgi:hypothetical protein
MTDQTTLSMGRQQIVVRDLGRGPRTVAFCAFTALIVLGPFMAQVLGVRNGLLRPWTMFAAVGVGILSGEFQAVGHDGTVVRLSPLQVFGAKRYPAMLSTQFPLRVENPGDLYKFAEAYCATHRVTLSYVGHVGSRQGWQALHGEDICKRPADGRD